MLPVEMFKDTLEAEPHSDLAGGLSPKEAAATGETEGLQIEKETMRECDCEKEYCSSRANPQNSQEEALPMVSRVLCHKSTIHVWKGTGQGPNFGPKILEI